VDLWYCACFQLLAWGALDQNGLTSLQLNAIHLLRKVQKMKQQTCWEFTCTSQKAMHMSYKDTEFHKQKDGSGAAGSSLSSIKPRKTSSGHSFSSMLIALRSLSSKLPRFSDACLPLRLKIYITRSARYASAPSRRTWAPEAQTGTLCQLLSASQPVENLAAVNKKGFPVLMHVVRAVL